MANLFTLSKEQIDIIPSMDMFSCVAKSVLIIPTEEVHESGYPAFTAIMFNENGFPIWKSYDGQFDNYKIKTYNGEIGQDFTKERFLHIFSKFDLLLVKTDCSDTLVISIADKECYKTCTPNMLSTIMKEKYQKENELEHINEAYNSITRFLNENAD